MAKSKEASVTLTEVQLDALIEQRMKEKEAERDARKGTTYAERRTSKNNNPMVDLCSPHIVKGHSYVMPKGCTMEQAIAEIVTALKAL